MTRLSVAALSLLPLLMAGLAPGPGIEPALAARLATLSPDKPDGYFLLAEEVADEGAAAADAEKLNLARTLYVLAFDLDRRTGHPGPLAASSAVGLAGI